MKITEFPISVYGQIEKYNDILSKARCRIFYKYENRNGTYISDEFAEKLLSSISYTPVKGIYNGEDFTDHGQERTEGRIYGIVPAEPNIAWEKHMDDDGVEREYACADVLIFTALYPEANQIVGSAQSMELYEPSLKYHFAIVKGQRYVVFDEGCFLGLQALGETVEPCFEGASFYTLQQTIEDAIQKIKEYSVKGGHSTMRVNFKISDNQKFDALWTLLNADYYTEENNWEIRYVISAVYDQYALAFDYEQNNYVRVYYKKDDEKDSIEITDTQTVYFMDVTESEKETVETLRKLNGDTYELVSENLTNADENAEKVTDLEGKVTEFEAKIVELNESIATLNTEASNAAAQIEEVTGNYTAAQEKIAELTDEVADLTNYKHNIELQQKQAVISEYAGKLSEELIQGYAEKIDEYSVVDLDKELAYELKKSGTFFEKEKVPFVPKDVEVEGIEKILSRYKKK